MHDASPVWYALIDYQQVGPMSASDLRRMIDDGRVGPGTLVWSEGMADWQPAGQCRALGDRFDATAGGAAGGAPPDPTMDAGVAGTGQFAGYAGFWKRFAAFLIDWLVTLVAGAVIGVIFGIVIGLQGMNDPQILENMGNVLGIVIGWLYYAVMESSPTQGTLGKMALGIKVTDMEGRPIGFGRATGRHFGKILSGLALMVGFLMIGFTEKKQGLHDMLAGCLVVNRA